MYSFHHSNLKGKPVYGFGSPNRHHGIRLVNGNSVKSNYDINNQLNAQKGKHGVYGRSKDPFKVYRNSQHHVVDTTKYFDRKGQKKNSMGVQEQAGKPTHVMSDMTFRKFKPKKGYLLVEDFKSYEDPIVHPHFVQNARIFESMRSSIGTRQRLDGSLIRNQNGEEEKKHQDEEKLEASGAEQKKIEDNKQNKNVKLRKQKKRPSSALNRRVKEKKSEPQKKTSENLEYDEIKKHVVTILNDEDFEIKYNSKKPNFRRPKTAKKKQISSDGLQKIAKDVYQKIRKQENTQKTTSSPVVEKKSEPVLQVVKQQIVQKKEEDERQEKKSLSKENEKKTEVQPTTQGIKTLSTIFASGQSNPKLTTTQYRRSYSPPKQRINRVESNAKELEMREKVNIEKRLGCGTMYNQMFRYSKMSVDEVKSIIPAGVGTLFSN